MPPIYLASDPIEAGIVRDYLLQHGVEVRVDGSLLWGGRGELAGDIYPRLYCTHEADRERARALIHTYERRASVASQWRCLCGETSPLHFELCWQCGADRSATAPT